MRSMSIAVRSDRPLSLWISRVRLDRLPVEDSRAGRVDVARGIMADSEVTQLFVSGIAPSIVSWSSQAVTAGPETSYDLVSGSTTSAAGINFSAAICLQSSGPASFSDSRPKPTLGNGFWYLARGRNSCGIGTYGSTARDTSVPSCP